MKQSKPCVFFRKPFIFLAAQIVFLLLSQNSCIYFQELKERREKAEVDLDSICKKIPIMSDFEDVDSKKSVDVEKVVIFRNFKAKASCKTVGEYYRSYFIELGWDRDRMQVKQRRGGMETVDFDFRLNDYLVSVECENDVDADIKKQVSISCSWGLR